MAAKRFNDYTNEELLTLDNETLNDSIRIEAIQQGVNPPMVLSEALRKSEWRGYKKPAEAIEVFEICTTNQYSSQQATGVGYLDKAKAEAALDGIVYIHNDQYSAAKGFKLFHAQCCIASRWVGVSKDEQAWSQLAEYTDTDSDKFQKVTDACIERLSRVRQDDYNRRVRIEKRTEFLRLAGGDESIAKNFWSKVQGGDWPDENGMPLPQVG